MNLDVDTKLLFRMFSEQGKRHWKKYVVALVGMIFIAGSTSASAWIMKDVINHIFIEKSMDSLLLISFFVVAIFVVKGLATYVQQTTLSRISNSIIADAQKRIFEKALNMKMICYDMQHSTELMAKQTFIAQSIGSALNLVVTVLFRDLMSAIGLVVVMLFQDWVMTLLAFTAMPVAIFFVKKISGKSKKVMVTEFGGFKKVLENLQEAVNGVRVVKAFNLQSEMKVKQFEAIDSFEIVANKFVRLTSRTSPIMETMGGVSIALVIIYGGIGVIRDGLEPGNFFAFITALLLAYEPMKRLARFNVDFNSNMVGVRAFYDFLDGETDERDGGTNSDEGLADVVFEHVYFSYGKRKALNDLSFRADAGKMTALVGRSGSGKTTVMNLLLRFYDDVEGNILIGGRKIEDLKLESLRNRIGYVGQDAFLFDKSLLENISDGRPGCSREDVEAAARSANAHDFIVSLPNGYDTICGEHGSLLSGGQRQRISIARALIKNADIILLDEATSSLDTESESLIREALKKLCVDKTTIVIAHRLGTIMSADKICVLDAGSIVDEGTHEELMNRGGIYKVLYENDFKKADS